MTTESTTAPEFVSRKDFDGLLAMVNNLAAKLKDSGKSVELLQSMPESLELIKTQLSDLSVFKEIINQGILDAESQVVEPNNPATDSPSVAEIVKQAVAEAEAKYSAERSKGEKRIKDLETAFGTEKEEKKRIQAESIAKSKKDGAFNSIKELTQSLNLLPSRERALLLSMREDGFLVDEEGSESYSVRVEREDPITKQKEFVTLPFNEGLPDLIKSKYTDFIAPRPGAGTAATATQNYSAVKTNYADLSPGQLREILQDPVKEKQYYAELESQAA